MSIHGRSRPGLRARLTVLLTVLGLVMGLHAIAATNAQALRSDCWNEPAGCFEGGGSGPGGPSTGGPSTSGPSGGGGTAATDSDDDDDSTADDPGDTVDDPGDEDNAIDAAADQEDSLPEVDAISGAGLQSNPYENCDAEWMALAAAPEGTTTEELAAAAYGACVHRADGSAIVGLIDPPVGHGSSGPVAGIAAPAAAVAARQATQAGTRARMASLQASAATRAAAKARQADKAPARHATSHRKAPHKRHAKKRRG